MVGGAQS